jgi:transposase
MPVLCLDIAMKSFDVVAETRRRWTAEERRQIVAESETGSVSAVARRHGVAVSLVFRWRRQAGLPGKRASVKKAGAVFVPLMLTAPAPPEAPQDTSRALGPDSGLIEIELASGRRVRLSGPVDVQALRRVIAVLEGR